MNSWLRIDYQSSIWIYQSRIWREKNLTLEIKRTHWILLDKINKKETILTHILMYS